MPKTKKELKKALIKEPRRTYNPNVRSIPFNRPWMDQREVKAAENVLSSLKIAGNGPICKDTQSFIQKKFKVFIVYYSDFLTLNSDEKKDFISTADDLNEKFKEQ